jgi:hypothetical protein
MSRYYDGDNLYYAGIRTDGQAVIKKKKDGIYHTLALTPLFPDEYDRTYAPNLIPHDTWIGLRIETVNDARGGVSIRLFTDVGHTDTWTLVAEAYDDGQSFGGSAHRTQGHLGVRTDFMDVMFDDFWVRRS